MDANNFKMKACSVILEPLTPKPQTSLSSELHNAIEERSLLTERSKKKILTDLKRLDDIYIEIDNVARRAKVVDELLNSEYSYIQQLKVIETYFMKPIKEQNILSDEDYQILFGAICSIRKLNEELVQKFDKSGDNIANVFMEMSPFLRVYSVYAYNYKKSLNILNVRSGRRAFFEFLELQESRPEVQQKFAALLIAPIQRIPRYCLLLQQILNYTDVSDPRYLPLTTSIKVIQKVVEHIDNFVGSQNDAQRLTELQFSLKNGFPCIIKADRKLIKEGILRKLSQRNNQLYKKYFLLMTDIIVYCNILKRNINSTNSLQCQGILPLNKCEVSEISKSKFNLKCKDVNMLIFHDNLKECEEWHQEIKQAIKMCQENKRSLRKDSSSRRPVFGKLVREYQEIGISPGIPRKKRQLDFDSGINKCLPATLTKRKCIRNTECYGGVSTSIPKIILPEYTKTQGQDSLYPLRRQLIEKNVRFSNSPDLVSTNPTDKSELKSNPEVYVFGNNHQNQGFRFKFGSIFGGVGKSLKKFFGFK